MGVGAGLYLYAVVVKSSRSLSHLLMSACFNMSVVINLPLQTESKLMTKACHQLKME